MPDVVAMNIEIQSIVFFLLAIVVKINVQGQAFVSVPAPKNVQVTTGSVTSTSMWVTWSAVPKADSYLISLTPPTIGAGGVGRGIRDTNSIISGLTPNTEYLITVRAMQGDVQGIPAVISQYTALPSPINVWAVEESITDNSMTVQWSTVEGAQYYTIEVRPSTGIGGTGKGSDATQAHLRGMTPNTLYTINIYAVNWVGTGAKAALQQYTKLNAPLDLVVVVATISPNTIGVQWREVVGAENYAIRVVPANDFNRNLPRIQDTRYVLRKLEPDTPYTIQVAASNAAGLSEYATLSQRTKSMCFAVANDYPEDTFTLQCPPRCERFNHQVFGTREYTSDSFICAAAIHDGRINSNVGGSVIVKKRPGILDFVGTYNNGITSKDYENWHRSYVFALQTPQNVRVQAGSVTHDRIAITWDPVSGAEAYRVTVIPSIGVLGIGSNIRDTRLTISGLQPNTTYRVYVSAVNRVETSDGATITQRTALPAPQNLQVMNNSVSYDRFLIAWDAMGVGTNLRYQISILSGDRIVLRDETTLTSYSATNLTSGSLYHITVRALNEVGLGKTSRIDHYTKLHKPINVEVTMVKSRSMRLEWKPVPGAKNFNVKVMPSNRIMRVDGYYVDIENLEPDQAYTVGVSSQNLNDLTEYTTIRQRTSLPPPNVEVVSGSLTHEEVALAWNPLRNALYLLVVVHVTEDDSSEILRTETSETNYTITGLVERRMYSISVMGISAAGKGENATIAIRTLVMPPNNLKVFSDGLRSTFVYLRWDEIMNIGQYYVSCEPSDGLQGLGISNRTAVRISGFRFNVTYKAMVMAWDKKDMGMNASSEFSTILPSPKLVIVHSITPSSLSIQWDPQSFQISTISYNTSSINRISKRISDDDDGRVDLKNLRANTYYQFNIFSNILSELLGTTGVQTPIATQTVVTAFHSNATDVTIFWPRILSDAPVNYLISSNPETNIRRRNITTTSITTNGFHFGDLYTISVLAENPARATRSDAATLHFTQGDGVLLFGETEADGDAENIWNFSVNNDDQNNNEAENINTNPGDENWGVLNDSNEINKEDRSKNEVAASSIWIVIVVLVACILATLLLIVIPCSCCGTQKKKPILRNYGCCGCCYRYYA